MNELLNTQVLSIWTIAGPWAAVIGSIIVGMWIKDWATGFAKGARFRMSKSFNEGDKVILEGKPALIIKIGFTETVFGVYNDDGYTWRFVQNERIPFLKLEKIVDKDLHQDTDQEKAQKIVDALQNAEIEKNKADIENIKNGNKS
jgi:hypothetical protein|tara:strand:+ start:3523 stop:3957 length:435 start_codon:yes stop_codon:yes gene_type:complete